MPEVFKSNGYKTHLIGKWHLGFHKKDFTPMNRGFDTVAILPIIIIAQNVFYFRNVITG